MHLFGNPSFPKRNLRGAAIMLTLLSFLFGTTLERLIWNHGTRVEYIFLVLWVGLLFTTRKAFLLALDSLPPDPKD